MARPTRVYIEGVLYYVTSKSGHATKLFDTHEDYREYISLIDKYKSQYGFKLFSFVLMPDHLHMLIELRNNIAISTIMHNINSLYTKLYNGRYGKKGHLFEARFKSVLAEKEIYLLQLTREIHLHPKIQNLVSDLKEYQYSSYPQYLDPQNRLHPNLKGEIGDVFKVLGGTEKEYELFMKEEDARGFERLERDLRKRRVLGSSAFGDRLKKLIEETARRQRMAKRGKPATLLLIVGGAALAVFAISSAYFYRGTAEFKSKYYKTLSLYERTLNILEGEKDRAIKEQRDIEDYAWKIQLTEKALNELKVEKETRLREEKALNGYAWPIEVVQTSGPAFAGDRSDIVTFADNKVSSAALGKSGFAPTHYSRRELKNGRIEWETIQRNAQGAIANWRGQWDGQRLQGVLRLNGVDGVTRDFSFVSTGERVKAAREAEAMAAGRAQ